MSPSTKRSATATPARPEPSSASPVATPRAKLPSDRTVVAALAFAPSTRSASSGSTGTLVSRARSRKLRARWASSAARAASISRAAVLASSNRATAWSASPMGSSWRSRRLWASNARGAMTIPAAAQTSARTTATLTRAASIESTIDSQCHQANDAGKIAESSLPKTICLAIDSPDGYGAAPPGRMHGPIVFPAVAMGAPRRVNTGKADGGIDRPSLSQHAGRCRDRDRRAGIHVRRRVGAVRSPACVPGHGRCHGDHLSVLFNPIPARSYT